MTTYRYTAVDREGNEQKGTMHARNKREVINKLKSQRLLITSLDLKKELLKDIFTFGRVPLDEKIMMIKNLSVMHSAGLSLADGLKILADQVTNRKLKKVLSEAQFDVESGMPLSSSLAKHPKMFSEIFIQMIRIGEVSGNLDKVLKYLSNQLSKEYDLKTKLKIALVYPIILIVSTFGIGLMLTIFVLPRVIEIFRDFGAKLPLVTRIVFATGEFILNFWLWGLIFLGFLTIIFWQLLRIKQGRKFISALTLKLPVFGKVIKAANLARFTRTLASLIASGIPIVESIEIVGRSLGNPFYSSSIKKVASNVKKGINLTKALSRYPDLFPPLVTRITHVGEKTGKLDSVLARLAAYYEFQVDNFTKNIAQIIEPILLLIIGLIIGLIAISIFGPIYVLVQEI